MLTPDLLAQLHEYELARALMLGERPLSPDQLIALAEHMEELADADERPTRQARQAPHVGASRVL